MDVCHTFTHLTGSNLHVKALYNGQEGKDCGIILLRPCGYLWAILVVVVDPQRKPV